VPIEYANSSNAGMILILFKYWFSNTFSPQVRKHLDKIKVPLKAVLLLDNCPAYPPAEILKSRYGNIKVTSTSPKTQPARSKPLIKASFQH